jgi:hypothetical protein
MWVWGDGNVVGEEYGNVLISLVVKFVVVVVAAVVVAAVVVAAAVVVVVAAAVAFVALELAFVVHTQHN